MARVKRGTTSHARHKKVLEQSKGFRGRTSTTYRAARERLEKSLQYAYRDRRNKKREFRGLWIQRINAATREHGLTYSGLLAGLRGGAMRWTARCWPPSPTTMPPRLARSSRRCRPPWPDRPARERRSKSRAA